MNPKPLSNKPSRLNKFIKGFIIIFTLLILIFFIIPRIREEMWAVARIKAISNYKHMGLALFAFEDGYGSYPSPETLAQINAKYPNHSFDLSGNSSNAMFRQLLAAGITDSEIFFWADIEGAIEPDNNVSRGQALKKGEVGFAYIAGLSSNGNPSVPLALTPLIPGTTKFDPKPFGGKAVIGRRDNARRVYDIHEDGHVYDETGIDILSPKHPFWNGKAPDIRYPE